MYVTQWSKNKTTEFFLLCWLVSTFCYHDDQFLFFWRSIHVIIIFFITSSITIELILLYQCRIIDIVLLGFNILTKDVINAFLFTNIFCMNIWWMQILLWQKPLMHVWCGSNCGIKSHNIVWIMHIHCMN